MGDTSLLQREERDKPTVVFPGSLHRPKTGDGSSFLRWRGKGWRCRYHSHFRYIFCHYSVRIGKVNLTIVVFGWPLSIWHGDGSSLLFEEKGESTVTSCPLLDLKSRTLLFCRGRRSTTISSESSVVILFSKFILGVRVLYYGFYRSKVTFQWRVWFRFL